MVCALMLYLQSFYFYFKLSIEYAFHFIRMKIIFMTYTPPGTSQDWRSIRLNSFQVQNANYLVKMYKQAGQTEQEKRQKMKQVQFLKHMSAEESKLEHISLDFHPLVIALDHVASLDVIYVTCVKSPHKQSYFKILLYFYFFFQMHSCLCLQITYLR